MSIEVEAQAEEKGKKRKSLQDRIVSKINAGKPLDYHKGIVSATKSSKEISSAPKWVARTGLDVFDTFTGGGFVIGRINEVFGIEGCGKSAIAIRAAIMFGQKQIYRVVPEGEVGNRTYTQELLDPKDFDVTVLYIDNEKTLSDDERVTIQVANKKCALDAIVAECDTFDQLFKMVENTLDLTAEEEKTTKRPQFVFIVIDTIAATSTQAEMKQDWDKDDFPRGPKEIAAGLRTLTRRVNKFKAAVICLNQCNEVFDKKAGGYGNSSIPDPDNFRSPGGKPLKYYSSTRTMMYPINKSYKLFKGQKFAAGMVVGFTTVKNRLVKPMRHARLVILFDGGYSDIYSKLETMVALEFITYRDSGGYAVRFSKIGVKGQGSKQSADLDDDDVDLDGRDPVIPNRAAWPDFYAANKENVDKLWEAAVSAAFAADGPAEDEESEDDIDLED